MFPERLMAIHPVIVGIFMSGRKHPQLHISKWKSHPWKIFILFLTFDKVSIVWPSLSLSVFISSFTPPPIFLVALHIPNCALARVPPGLGHGATLLWWTVVVFIPLFQDTSHLAGRRTVREKKNEVEEERLIYWCRARVDASESGSCWMMRPLSGTTSYSPEAKHLSLSDANHYFNLVNP